MSVQSSLHTQLPLLATVGRRYSWPMAPGRYLPLTPPRLWIGDLLELSRALPLVPFERHMNLARVAEARRHAGVGWCALFVKAMGMVSQRRPELRRALLPWPWPRLYEHGASAAMIAVEREWHGELGVFFGQIDEPENRPLVEIEALLRELKTAPVESVREFRRLFRVARLPRLMRRLAWRYAHRVCGPTRVKYFGTFGVSVTAGEGATALSLVSPSTSTLHYGIIAPDGGIDVRLTFDHRVLDGAPVARALMELEETLCGEVLSELHAVRCPGCAAPANASP